MKANAILHFNNGIIEDNEGNQSIFHVDNKGTLNLNDVEFRNNIQYEKNIPSCIKSQAGHIDIFNCQFLDHSSSYCPWSAFLIYTIGSLDIRSSKFENNKAVGIDSFCCIKV